MKWFKFIIWVQLFLSAMMYFVSAFKLFFGLDYRAEGLTSDIVYSVYPGLQALDVVVALLFVLMAVMAILVRFQLNGFKSRAPMFYLGFIGVALAASLAYPVGVSLICGTPGLSITALAACLTYVALFAVNVVYFRKRRHLFVN